MYMDACMCICFSSNAKERHATNQKFICRTPQQLFATRPSQFGRRAAQKDDSIGK